LRVILFHRANVSKSRALGEQFLGSLIRLSFRPQASASPPSPLLIDFRYGRLLSHIGWRLGFAEN